MHHYLFPPSKDAKQQEMDVKQIDWSNKRIKDALVLLYLEVPESGFEIDDCYRYIYSDKQSIDKGHQKYWDLYKRKISAARCIDSDHPTERLVALWTKYDENRNPFYQWKISPKFLPDDELKRLMREKVFTVRKSELDSMVEKIESLMKVKTAAPGMNNPG